MPGGDGTGPMGQGSMTGKGFGNCLSWGIPALAGAAMAFGFGRRRGWFGRTAGRGFGAGPGRGMGWGFAQNFAGGTPFKNDELTTLKEEAKIIQDRISELENQ